MDLRVEIPKVFSSRLLDLQADISYCTSRFRAAGALSLGIASAVCQNQWKDFWKFWGALYYVLQWYNLEKVLQEVIKVHCLLYHSAEWELENHCSSSGSTWVSNSLEWEWQRLERSDPYTYSNIKRQFKPLILRKIWQSSKSSDQCVAEHHAWVLNLLKQNAARSGGKAVVGV